MQRVSGIGGLFFRGRDPEALGRWYDENLGVRGETWEQEAGPTVSAPFAQDTEYFGGPEKEHMVDFRVGDLDAMLAQPRAAGANVEEKVEERDYGRFGWVVDPEGNRIELWEPQSG